MAYALFLTVFLGMRATGSAQAASGSSLAAIVVGLVVWLQSLRAFRGISGRLASEASRGTLEQLAMSPVGLSRVLVYQAIGEFGIQLVQTSVLLVLIMATTGKWLHLDLVSILPLLVLTVAGAQGLGFLMGGVSLVYKRVSALFTLFQYLFIALVAVPVTTHPAMKWLPLGWGSYLIRQVMVERVSLLQLPAGALAIHVAASVGYFGLGFAAFRFMERKARDEGHLGHY
jgi:ABC-2 type transport system permease protein